MVQHHADDSADDRLLQSQLAGMSLSESPTTTEMNQDYSNYDDTTEDQTPDIILRSLVSDNGLVVVLESMKTLVSAQISRLQDSPVQQYETSLKAFQRVYEDLTILIESLPSELDIEIALVQITHSIPPIEPTPTKLPDDYTA